MTEWTDAELYEKHSEELVRYATFLVGPDRAADVTSDAVVRVLASRKWRQVAEPKAYLFRAVLNEARRQGRRDAARHRRERRTASVDRYEPPEARFEVRDAVDGLSPQQRAVIYLTYWDDLTPEATAGVLGISEGSVRRHLARARERLRGQLDDRS